MTMFDLLFAFFFSIFRWRSSGWMRCRGKHIASMQLVIILCIFDDGHQMMPVSRQVLGGRRQMGQMQICSQQIILVRGAYFAIFFLLLSSFLFLVSRFFFLRPALIIDCRMFHLCCLSPSLVRLSRPFHTFRAPHG